MSCIVGGKVIDTDLSRNARGGTEQMRARLINSVPADLLSKVAIHLSRPRKLYEGIPNILWLHDLAEDPENVVLNAGGWQKFDHFVFVSHWQRSKYLIRFGIPIEKTSVIENAIEPVYIQDAKPPRKPTRFIYHTTPHRGLEILVPVFAELHKTNPNIHLDVFSSFSVYGWQERDKPYVNLFAQIDQHPGMTYHGGVSNDKIREALKAAHIFLYPCIWKETSCIALIEAINTDVVCIHPEYGALSETAGDKTLSYEWTSDHNEHAKRAYMAATYALNNYETLKSEIYADNRHNLNTFGMTWILLLNQILSSSRT